MVLISGQMRKGVVASGIFLVKDLADDQKRLPHLDRSCFKFQVELFKFHVELV